jgi:hypothetical protein
MFTEHRDKMEYDGYAGPYNAFVVAPEDTQLVLDHKDIFSTYYYYPAALPRAQYKFAVEAVDALRHLGPFVLRYLLRAFEQRLSRLVFAMRDWASQAGRTELPNTELVEEFVSAKFGPCHHLTSLTRYALHLPEGTNDAVAFDPDRQYQLDMKVRLLDPDLQALLSLFEQPRSCREVTDLVAEVSGVNGLSSSYFAPFIDAGILISAPAAHTQ